MDKLILSDKLLNQQVCTECLNYLSVGPVMVSCGEKIICGRCSSYKNSEMHNSLYNLVAGKLVFRCINYYGGCEELLNFNEAVEHEKQCKKDLLKCPFCDYEGNGCQLIHHFDKDHPECVMKDDTFKIVAGETFSKSLIFIKSNYIFCLIFSGKDTFIEFSNLLISPAHLGPKHIKLRFFKLDSNVEFVTSPIQVVHELKNFSSSSFSPKNVRYDIVSNHRDDSFLLDQTSLFDCFPSRWCLCKIELISNCDIEEKVVKLSYLEKIQKKLDVVERAVVKERDVDNFDINRVSKMSEPDLRKFVNTELQLLKNCVNCKKYITSVVYFCPKYHMACKDCSNSKCIECGIFCIWSSRPNNISLTCEWIGCGARTNIFNYMNHKRDCTRRRYKCPDVYCEFEGLLVDLKKVHWHVNPIFDCNELTFRCKSQSLFWHIPNYHELFYISMEYNSLSKQSLVVIKQVDVVMPTCYEFVAGFSTDLICYKTVSKQNLKNRDSIIEFHITDVSLQTAIKLSCVLKT